MSPASMPIRSGALAPADGHEGVFGKTVEAHPIEVDRTGGRPVHRSDQVQQSGLAAAGRTLESYEFAGLGPEANPSKCWNAL